MRLLSLVCYALFFLQSNHSPRTLKVVSVVEYKEGYVLTGIDTLTIDTVYFVSLKGILKYKKSKFKKINIGETYAFDITDMDNVNGHLPAALPNGYSIKIGKTVLKRNSRYGKTINTTQYLARNTTDLYVCKKKLR